MDDEEGEAATVVVVVTFLVGMALMGFFGFVVGGCAHVPAIQRSQICAPLCDAAPEAMGRMTMSLYDEVEEACFCVVEDPLTGRAKTFRVPLPKTPLTMALSGHEGTGM